MGGLLIAEPGEANGRWGEMLSDWAIPDEIVAAAPESPYFFDPQVFIAAADQAMSRTDDTPSDAAARNVLPAAGTVLDVGCGAGAASLRLHPAEVTGVDPSAPLLAAFTARATSSGIGASTVEGVWPDAAVRTGMADVVVCHHVFYNIADLAAFASALTDHARHRTVVELTTAHPMSWLAPYWKGLYGLDQPAQPTVDDAVAVLAELGYEVRQERWRRDYQMIGETSNRALARIARRLCLPVDRYDELRHLLGNTPPPTQRGVATLWW
jgi:SAM-dependent methyltransferase